MTDPKPCQTTNEQTLGDPPDILELTQSRQYLVNCINGLLASSFTQQDEGIK